MWLPPPFDAATRHHELIIPDDQLVQGRVAYGL